MIGELLAAAFLVFGAAVALIAAIGVARLPDPFLRMHAATKAGVVGAGLFLIGVGFAFGETGVWLRVAAALAFLLITTPIASHILGRAAYVAGAPLWSGTMTDHLSGVLTRGVFDIDPSRTVRRPRPAAGPIPEGSAMSILAFEQSSIATAAQQPRRTGIRRILLALADGPHLMPAIRHAVALARWHGAAVTGLAVVDLPTVENVGPVPLGGIHWARLQRETRLRLCRERSAAALAAFAAACRDAGVAYAVRHEEQAAERLLARAAASHDLVLLPARQWFDHGVCGASRDPRRLVGRVRPLVMLAGDSRPVRNLAFLHDGSARAAVTLRWLLQLGLWAEATVHLVGQGEPSRGLDEALAEAAAHVAAHGGTAVLAGRIAPDDDLDPGRLPPGRPDAIVVGNAGRSGAIRLGLRGPLLRALDRAECPVVLG